MRKCHTQARVRWGLRTDLPGPQPRSPRHTSTELWSQRGRLSVSLRKYFQPLKRSEHVEVRWKETVKREKRNGESRG